MAERRLIVIRHAKAVQGDADHERPLADRGFKDAAAIGALLAGSGLVPDRVVVSTSLRTRQTWETAANAVAGDPEVVADHRIYVNTVGGLLAIVHETPVHVDVLALVGHNPSMAELVNRLDDGSGDAAALQALDKAFRTSGVAVFGVNGDWVELGLGDARLISYAVARG
ncbi:MAG TPA: histidine phosphatase family protein [Mycobacteriales bacterium]|nr:histidine phosphatase family protein [Mycobacteriales bacterium]